ncbi:MAG: AAA family ATPase [Theionarchaea archaeon]|nr:AAA family ATPase [Theionarchaea archaeon]
MRRNPSRELFLIVSHHQGVSLISAGFLPFIRKVFVIRPFELAFNQGSQTNLGGFVRLFPYRLLTLTVINIKPYKGTSTPVYVERIITGIPGLDEIIGGGFPKGTNILVCGGSGTGKTIFCTQFLVEGIKKGEPGIFITLEERTSDLREEMLPLGWDLAEYERNGDLIIIDAASSRINLPSTEEFKMGGGFDIDSLVLEIHRAATKIDAKRLIIDSIPALELKINESSEFRKALFRLSSLLLEIGLTSLMTTESTDPYMISRYGIEEFVARGVIVLSLEEEIADLRRYLRVRKIRGTLHSLRSVPFEITKNGIVLYVTK